MQKIVAHWRELPDHVRRGLLRLYVVVSVAWVAWFGSQLLYALNDYDPDGAAEAFWWLLLVPVGVPILFLVIGWVVAGFRKTELGVDKAPEDKAVSQFKFLARLCFSFSGRVNRAKYWIGLGIAYGMMLASAVPVILGLVPEFSSGLLFVGGLWLLVWGVAEFAVATKRLHDLDISGWWLLGFVIVFGLLVNHHHLINHYQMLDIITGLAFNGGIIWLGSAKGTKGSNRFGPDPIPRLATEKPGSMTTEI
jgi:uncharacterized membrane protein YhaH (DUF805 family)